MSKRKSIHAYKKTQIHQHPKRTCTRTQRPKHVPKTKQNPIEPLDETDHYPTFRHPVRKLAMKVRLERVRPVPGGRLLTQVGVVFRARPQQHNNTTTEQHNYTTHRWRLAVPWIRTSECSCAGFRVAEFVLFRQFRFVEDYGGFSEWQCLVCGCFRSGLDGLGYGKSCGVIVLYGMKIYWIVFDRICDECWLDCFGFYRERLYG